MPLIDVAGRKPEQPGGGAVPAPPSPRFADKAGLIEGIDQSQADKLAVPTSTSRPRRHAKGFTFAWKQCRPRAQGACVRPKARQSPLLSAKPSGEHQAPAMDEAHARP